MPPYTSLHWFPTFLIWIVWLGVVIYLITLASRFVSAVERMADKIGK
jgi:hypothetical protein